MTIPFHSAPCVCTVMVLFFCQIFLDCSDFSFSVVFNLRFCSKATTCMMYTGVYIYILTDTVDSLFKGTCQPKLHQSDLISLHTLHSYLGNQSSKQILPVTAGSCWQWSRTQKSCHALIEQTYFLKIIYLSQICQKTAVDMIFFIIEPV